MSIYHTDLHTGDIHDDDAAVQELTGNANPPSADELPQTPALHVPVTDRPKRPTRLMTGTLTFNASVSTAPIQLLWHDENRTGLKLFIYSATATDSVTISDDITKTGGSATTQQSASLAPGHDPICLDGFTGPIYVAAEVGTVRVSWISITC